MIAAEDFGAGRLAQAIVNSLAVLGAFFIGYMLAAVIGYRFFQARPSSTLNRAGRLAAGFALALLAAMILFGHGRGWTLVGGGGQNNTNEPINPQPISTPIPQPEPTQPATHPTDTLGITILGGMDVVEQRFYLVDGTEKPLTLPELKAWITDPSRRNTPSRIASLRFPARNRLPNDHPAVTMLVRWLREEAGWAVTLPPDQP